MTIGERIKETRVKLNISQVDFADKINVSKQTLYKYENNIITNIPSDKIEAIAKIGNVSPAFLMGWDIQENCIERIKTTCIEQNISLSQLEDDLGFTAGYISHARNTTLPMDKLQKISEYLGKSVDYFISEEEMKPNESRTIPKELEDIMSKYRFIAEYSPKGKEAVDYAINREFEIAKMIKSNNSSGI